MIQKARHRDIKKIVSLYLNCSNWLENYGMDHWKNYWPEKRIKEYISKGELYILVHSTRIIGSIILSENKPYYYRHSDSLVWEKSKEKAIYLSGLAINPIYHKKGFGKKLLKFSEDITKKKNINFIRLDVIGEYIKLHEMYKHYNFKSKGIMEHNYYKNILFEKII